MYPVPANCTQAEIEIKKSRFFGRAGYVSDRESAFEYLRQVKKLHPDARHHCWAYLVGDPNSPSGVAASDDGEPSGTAGKPILNVLQHKGVGDVIIVVTRYFGGIKLGAGGLIRAYSSAAQLTMDPLRVKPRVDLTRIRVRLDFAHEQDLRHWLSTHGGTLQEVAYQDTVSCLVLIPQELLPEFQDTSHARGWETSKD